MIPDLTGTANQVEWAEQIRLRAADEFDRVAKAFEAVAGRQPEQDRLETRAVIRILEEKRAETMANPKAGYFIREWQELDGKVRRLIAADARYCAMEADRAARRKSDSDRRITAL